MTMEIPRTHESENDKIYAQLDGIRKTILSQGFRDTPMHTNEDTMLSSGLELMLAFYGTGAGWIGRNSRVQFAQWVDEGRGKDLIFFLRKEKSGEEFVIAADATIGMDSVKKKVKGSFGRSEKSKGRVQVTDLRWLVPDALSDMYQNRQPKIFKQSYVQGGRRALPALQKVPLIVLGVDRDTLRSIFSDPTTSLQVFQKHPVQLRFLEQMYIQLQAIRQEWDERPQNDINTVETRFLLGRMTKAVMDIYAERYHVVAPEHRNDFNDDTIHKKLFDVVAQGETKTRIKELQFHAERHPTAGKHALENPHPIVKREQE